MRYGRQINNFCVVYYTNIHCAKQCRNLSTYVDTTVKGTQGTVFLDSHCMNIFRLYFVSFSFYLLTVTLCVIYAFKIKQNILLELWKKFIYS